MSVDTNNDVCIPRAEAIAQLNDALRRGGDGGTIVVTRGVQSLPGYCPLILVTALGAYDAFDEDNDPHGERDLGDVDLFGASLLWKIDYYDKALEYGSPDAADTNVTTRVLTVMLMSEY